MFTVSFKLITGLNAVVVGFIAYLPSPERAHAVNE
jgi:hypothetical protein